MLVKIKNNDTERVASVLIKQSKKLPIELQAKLNTVAWQVNVRPKKLDDETPAEQFNAYVASIS